MNPKIVTLGSLFDGVGAFPLAASYFGIKAIWASEILPAAVSVTKRHFPDMEHLGDITKLDGGKIPPVHVLCFGSPCQSFSVAGPRTHFNGKSILFFEAIRIIREMRIKTSGKYPKIVVFENVAGLFSVDSRRAYQTVLEAFCETEIPMPQSGRWANAGMVRGRGIDLAWVVKNAQYHRTAQRRRRIFLVANFGAPCAAEILFDSSCLRGYFAARENERQGASAYAAGGFRGAGDGANHTNCLNPEAPQQSRIHTPDGVSPTLTGCDMGGGRAPGGLVITPAGEDVLCVASGQSNAEINQNTASTLTCHHEPPFVCAAFTGGAAATAGGVGYSETVAPTLRGSSGSSMTPCICEPQIARTLTARGDGSPNVDGGPNIVAFEQNMRNEVRDLHDVAGCLAANAGVKQRTYIAQPAVGVHQNQAGDISVSDTAYTLSTNSNATGRNAPLVAHPDVAGTLCASGAGLSRPAGNANETDLCVVQCQPIPIQDKATRHNNGGAGNGLGVGKPGDPAYTITTSDRSIVAAVDCRNLKEVGDISGTLQAKNTPGYSLNYQNPVRTGYIIRRLTPMEAERCMSLPDGWTAYGHDGKPISDTQRYALCGNSIVVNCLAYIMQNIAAHLNREGND